MKKLLRIVFSRYTLSALLILTEIALITVFALYTTVRSWVFMLIAALVSVGAFFSLINRDTNPEFKLTWLCVTVILPVVGGLLYIIFYHRRLRKGEAKFLAEMASRIKVCEAERGELERSRRALDGLSQASKSAAGKALALLGDDYLASVFPSGKLTYYSSGEEMFEAMEESLSKAEKYIFLEYFIVEDGIMWQRMLSILDARIAAGVEVRMLYDDIGSMSTVPSSFSKALRERGIKCYRFGEVSPKLTSSHNNRDHRKICVIDGKVAFTGGINIADEYINEKSRFGHWKDGGIKIEGNAARGFARLFLMLYDMTLREFSDYEKYLPKSLDEDIAGGSDGGYVIPFGAGPARAYAASVGKNVLMNIINMSERYLYITTPYLIIDYDLTEALCMAARRGVDVRIITPAVADKKAIKIMTKSSYPHLISSGVRIFEYTPGFIHEKSIVCDDTYAVIGTINLDFRSLVHHFEDGIWIFQNPVITDIRDRFMATESCSEEMLEDDARLRLRERLVRNLIRIFAPLL